MAASAPVQRGPDVSIVIPVFQKLAFTRQCLDRLWRHTGSAHSYEVIVVDNGSSDGTPEYFGGDHAWPVPVVYHRNGENLGFARGNNIGARLARGRYLLFLNNDTLVQPRWLEEMVGLAESDAAIGIVGIQQLFPYTNTIHHTGIVFTAGGVPQHLYPHADARLPHVNKQREYQAVTGACLLIGRPLFEAVGGFDERYVNGYEDVDLCAAVRQRGRKVVCCTAAHIFHYGQITAGRTADDDQNAAYFASKWGTRLRADEGDYFQRDLPDIQQASAAQRSRAASTGGADALYFLDDLSQGGALAWAVADLALALKHLGVPVHLTRGALADTLGRDVRRELEGLMVDRPHPDGTHLKWSHFWPRHLSRPLRGRLNLEFFVINYRFGQPGSQPWDYWLQCLRQTHSHKLPLTRFCQEVLEQVGVPAADCDILPLGYAREVHQVAPDTRGRERFRFLTVTNSHDLARYGTARLLEAYWEAFGPRDPVVLTVRDYGVGAADPTLGDLLGRGGDRAAVEYRPAFTSKRALIELYRSSDAFVSAHRGEGFGMKILDALACGLPVITPLFGGPRDFCAPASCFPVAFTLVPLGDCLDARELRLTNEPLWAEPDRADLARQLRAVFEDPAAARAVGEQGRRDVIDRFSWEESARRLVRIVDRLKADQPAPARGLAGDVPASHEETSPYWLGCRVSVLIPSYNRKEILLECLRALEKQSILPQEFEVVVVDDGSTDGTEAALAAETFPFRLTYQCQTNQGQGAARNAGVPSCQGELVLFIGDDIIADERLLEAHLLAHARRPEPGAAVLGHIDWAPWLTPTPVMDYVCGEGGHQFGYRYLDDLPSLDYRFFYTSNISLKRRFLLDALQAGIRFDPCFRTYGYEDTEFAYRLEGRGLTIHYQKDARAYHDHWMDLAAFIRREYSVGQMGVVFYRKHPELDPILHVRWIADWTDAVETLSTQADPVKRVKALDAHTDELLRVLEGSLEELLTLDSALVDGGLAAGFSRDTLRQTLHRLFAILFAVERARGKIQEWYRDVEDKEKVETAKALLSCLMKLAFFTANAQDIDKLQAGPLGLISDVATTLAARAQELDAQLRQHLPGAGLDAELRRQAPGATGSPRSRLARIVLRGPLVALLRGADRALQGRLRRAGRDEWLARYRRLRERARRLVL
ncbi:MAG TPA: glycosyltransferase [Methylomirabilota bacterium]|nr:glycosyltransferase [Methylomirabilota bacterium]